MATGLYLSIITLNVSGLMPKPKDKDWLNGYKTRPLYILSTGDPSQNKRHIQTKSEGLEKIFHANGDQKNAGVTILISDKIDFNKKKRL